MPCPCPLSPTCVVSLPHELITLASRTERYASSRNALLNPAFSHAPFGHKPTPSAQRDLPRPFSLKGKRRNLPGILRLLSLQAKHPPKVQATHRYTRNANRCLIRSPAAPLTVYRLLSAISPPEKNLIFFVGCKDFAAWLSIVIY